MISAIGEPYDNVYLIPVNALSLAISASSPPDCITLLDNNKRCDGHSFRGVRVFSPALHKIPPEATVVVCSFLSRKAITYQLSELGIRNVLYYGDILSDDDYGALMEAFKSITVDELRALSSQHVNLYEVGVQKIRNAWQAVQSKVVINNVNWVPTLRCTLKCKDCSALIPYFEEPSDFNTADMCKGLCLLSELVDSIVMCTILGGEPFLHKDIGAIAACASALDNIVSVAINTNGTVLPTPETYEKLSKLDSFSIVVSDYGPLSRHKDELVERSHKHGIKTAVFENIVWYDFCKIIESEGRTRDEIDRTYNTCSIACAGLVKNVFSRCYPALILTLLHAVPPDAYGEVSVIDLSTATRDDIEKHLNSDTPLQACAVCSGKSRSVKQIPPALQTDMKMTYRKYN